MYVSSPVEHKQLPFSRPAMRRLADRVGVGTGLNDAFWSAFEPHLTEKRDGRGRPAFNKRATLEAIIWVATTRRNWRDIPRRYGMWNSIYRQFSRWSEAGVWEFLRLQDDTNDDYGLVLDAIMDLWGREKHRRRDRLVARADYQPDVFQSGEA